MEQVHKAYCHYCGKTKLGQNKVAYIQGRRFEYFICFDCDKQVLRALQ